MEEWKNGMMVICGLFQVRSSGLMTENLERMKVTGLRSAYEKVDGIVYFGRMIDKIRLHQAGKLPEDYLPYLGACASQAFDGRCCRFLQVDYSQLTEAVKGGRSEMEVLEWAYRNGRNPSEEDVEIWNNFMQKRGWHDEASPRLSERKQEAGIVSKSVLTFFDYFDADEGRPPRFDCDAPIVRNGMNPTVSIPGLRSACARLGGIFHFGRMLDKIRLAAKGKLPAAWLEANGSSSGFDGSCSRFLRIEYSALKEQAEKGINDDEMLNWAFSNGRKPSDEEIEIWNAYLSKRCWRDQYSNRLHHRLQQAGMPIGAALTMFDFIDLDEGRTAILQ
jgi:hypothetical protein